VPQLQPLHQRPPRLLLQLQLRRQPQPLHLFPWLPTLTLFLQVLGQGQRMQVQVVGMRCRSGGAAGTGAKELVGGVGQGPV